MYTCNKFNEKGLKMTNQQAAIEHRENMAFISEYCGFMSNAELSAWSKEQDRLWHLAVDSH